MSEVDFERKSETEAEIDVERDEVKKKHSKCIDVSTFILAVLLISMYLFIFIGSLIIFLFKGRAAIEHSLKIDQHMSKNDANLVSIIVSIFIIIVWIVGNLSCIVIIGENSKKIDVCQ